MPKDWAEGAQARLLSRGIPNIMPMGPDEARALSLVGSYPLT